MSRRNTAAAALAALGAVAAGASAAGWLGASWWIFDLASHFRLQCTISLVIALLGLAVLGRWRWALALLPFAAVNVAQLRPYWPQGGAIATTSTSTALRLVNANLLVRNRNAEALLAVLAESRPDIVVLAEYTERWQRNLAVLDASYPFHVRATDAGPYGIAILSRLPLHDAGVVKLGRTPAITADVELDGQRVRLIGVHLRSPISGRRSAERNAQLEELTALARAADRPLIVLGDFNSSPFSPHFARWLARAGLRDASQGRGLVPTWPVSLPMLRIPIDHCILSSDFTVLDSARLPSFGSDHFPLLTVVALKERG